MLHPDHGVENSDSDSTFQIPNHNAHFVKMSIAQSRLVLDHTDVTLSSKGGNVELCQQGRPLSGVESVMMMMP